MSVNGPEGSTWTTCYGYQINMSYKKYEKNKDKRTINKQDKQCICRKYTFSLSYTKVKLYNTSLPRMSFIYCIPDGRNISFSYSWVPKFPNLAPKRHRILLTRVEHLTFAVICTLLVSFYIFKSRNAVSLNSFYIGVDTVSKFGNIVIGLW